MAVGILIVFALACVLIATERWNGINKAAVAMFAGVVCWILYICYGKHFVLIRHGAELQMYMQDLYYSSKQLKEFIAEKVFMQYAGNAADVVLYLLGTMTIVKVLDNNDCFNFIKEALYTLSPKKFLWLVTLITFLISANLDNLTTVCIMLAFMNSIVADDRSRFIYGSSIVLAANCGGAFTVIGDPMSLVLWSKGLISPTHYSQVMVLPCVVTLLVTTLLVQRTLPAHIQLVHTLPAYRGDTHRLSRLKRIFLLFVGLGGLWFIPTFHRLTMMPIFVGSLCVLSIVWVINEIYNRKYFNMDMMFGKRKPVALQYQNLQFMLFFLGMAMAVGALNETEIFPAFGSWLLTLTDNVYLLGIIVAALSTIFSNVTMVLSNISLFGTTSSEAFGPEGIFWPVLSFCTAVGGTMLTLGSFAGYALWRMENVSLRWYVRHFLPKIFFGGLAGFLCLWMISHY